MDARDSKFVVRLLPSLGDFAFLFPLALLFGVMGGAGQMLQDGDVGWHIRAGDWILANGRAPSLDLFSFSKPTEPWFAWEWLSEVIWSLLHTYGGLAALVLFGCGILSVTFLLLYRLAKRRSNPVVALGVTVVAAAAGCTHWLARPHLFTLLFMVVTLHALEAMREERRLLFGIPWWGWAPALSALWTNLHGGFVGGIALMLCYAAGEGLNGLFEHAGETREAAIRRARQFAICGGTALAASLINPYGWRLHWHVARYLADPFNGQHIQEFFSVSFHHPMTRYFEIMLALAALACIRAVSKRRFVEPVALMVWAHGALLAARNISIFAIVAAPAAAAALSAALRAIETADAPGWLPSMVRRFNGVTDEMAAVESIPRWRLASVFGIAALATLLFAPNPPKVFAPRFDPKSFPVRAVETLASTRDARIYAHDQWSDYLIYRLYPSQRVFVDGRSDFYGAKFEEKVLGLRNARYGWHATVREYGINTMLVSPDAPLAGTLKESSAWRLVYDDGVALVFRSVEQSGRGTNPAAPGGGFGRDREITKTAVRDRAITSKKTQL